MQLLIPDLQKIKAIKNISFSLQVITKSSYSFSSQILPSSISLRSFSEGGRLRSSVFRLPSSVFRLPSSVFRLRSSVFRLPSSVFRLPSSVFRLPSSVFRLPSSVFRLKSALRFIKYNKASRINTVDALRHE
jgi:hypothetical protein